MAKPILYSGTRNASSWAMRAWLALRAANVGFVEEVVDIRRPQRFRELARMSLFSPSASVPALIVEQAVLFDSLAIMEFANEAASGALLPGDDLARGQARSILAWQHSGLSGICSRISFESSFYPLKRRLAPDEISECSRLFGYLEKLLSTHDGPYLFGAASLADFALAPTVVRLSRHQPPMASFPATERWMDLVISHPLVIEWLSEADSLPPVWLEDYLIPGEPASEAFAAIVDKVGHD
ncbi:MAG TPA: glutathione S-transferase family protein [Allosphingosinicella sp.]|nr:glutathione S-transferase family protein [Allosphingosinicella sp.]